MRRERSRQILDNRIMASIADIFAAQLAEMEEQDRKSREKTAQTLQRVRSMIAELEAMEFPED